MPESKKTEEKKENSHAYHEVHTLLEWSAPGRPFRKKGKEYYTSVLLIGLLIEVILFLFSDYQLMVVVAAVIFLAFTLSSIPPKNFQYKITSEGIQVEDIFYIWGELYDFYFKKMDGEDVLFVRTHAIIPGELHMPLGEHPRDHLIKVLLPYLPYREIVKPTFMEKSADWLTRTFPLESHKK